MLGQKKPWPMREKEAERWDNKHGGSTRKGGTAEERLGIDSDPKWHQSP